MTTIHKLVIPVDDQPQDGDDGMLDMIARLIAGHPACQCGKCTRTACEDTRPAAGDDADTDADMDGAALDLCLAETLVDLRKLLTDACGTATDAANTAIDLDRIGTAIHCHNLASNLLYRIEALNHLLDGDTDSEEEDQ